MKTRMKVLLVMLSVAFFSTTAYATIQNLANTAPLTVQTNNQGPTIIGVYKGHDESGYNFSIVDAKGMEIINTFSNVEESLAKSNDLESKSVIGTTYEITYTTDKEGNKTITSLKPQF